MFAPPLVSARLWIIQT